MTKKITQKIVGFEVSSTLATQDIASPAIQDNVVQMHERVQRPDTLLGSTYKIKTPLSEHALYVTINDIILNQATEHEQRRPFEIFINSKSMAHFQWIVALTRIISATFRKGGDINFLVEELHSVFDPNGGYLKPGGKYMPSLVAEIGSVLQNHLQIIGMLTIEELNPQQKELIAQKRATYEQAQQNIETTTAPQNFPDSAQICKKCQTKAAIKMDGCLTCLNCGESKCG